VSSLGLLPRPVPPEVVELCSEDVDGVASNGHHESASCCCSSDDETATIQYIRAFKKLSYVKAFMQHVKKV
jgi:hypothetical protein